MAHLAYYNEIEPFAAEWLKNLTHAEHLTPGTFPLAHGVSGRVGRLRAYGNAIVPQVAAAFIMSFMDAASEKQL